MEAKYVIVGGGSAGCVLANRLSENPANTVVLIEAGPPDTSPFIHMPAGIIPVIRSDKLNWKYWTAKEPNMGDRRMFWPRGRTLGGSSSINAMCYIRGHAHDYDHWAALGCQGWGYEDVLPYFRKSENFEPDEATGPDHYHGVGGPLNVAAARFMNPLMDAFVKAGVEAGYTRTTDFNGATQEGIGYYHVMQKGGQRCSNAKAFLAPIRNRPNLTVRTDAHVEGVRFEGKRAAAVKLRKGEEIKATHEIILAAGALGSPQLLMLSGIGPGAHLQTMEIPLVHESAGVGENLQDHLDVNVTVREKTRHAVSLHPGTLWRNTRDFWHYSRHKKGELTSNYAQAGAFLKTSPSEPIPDIQLHFVPFVYSNHGRDLGDVLKYWGYTLMACDLRPKSRGRITLNSRDAQAPPKIEARYLSHESELARLTRGIEICRNILAQKAFDGHRGDEMAPGAKLTAESDIQQWIRQKAETIYHPVGTCRMGADAGSVVDLELRVRGVEGLRVIDASIMPTLVGGNTNAPATMIAEKGAEFILATA